MQNRHRFRSTAATLMLFIMLMAQPFVMAHGDEDHSKDNQTSKTAAGGENEPVIVMHTARLGNFEIFVKHPAITPDTPTGGRLFVSDFATNAPAGTVETAVEIESASGVVTPVTAQKASAGGSFDLQFPALPAGTYTLRTKITTAGNTDTVTFSGLQVQAPANQEAFGAWSWRTALIAIVGMVVLGLFGGLIYFVLRSVRETSPIGERVSV